MATQSSVGPDTLPLGKLTALMAAGLITLIGVVADLDPEIILFRSLVGGLGLGVLAALARVVVVKFINPR